MQYGKLENLQMKNVALVNEKNRERFRGAIMHW
jgi:hypothetical protein